MDENELNEIEARAKAATHGPWITETKDYDGKNWLLGSIWCGYYDGEDHWVHITTDHVQGGQLAGSTAALDAMFIASARADVPDLVDEVRRLRAISDAQTAEIEKLRATLKQYADTQNWMKYGSVPISLGDYADIWGYSEDGHERARRALEGGNP